MMKQKGFLRRILAAALAGLMLVGVVPVALAVQDDWQDLWVAVSWVDGDGNETTFEAVPVEEQEGAFWVQVPGEALGSLTLQIDHPGHMYEFSPANGEVITAQDAGTTLDSRPITIQAEEEGRTDTFYLYVSTQSSYPVTEEEPEPTEEPTPVPTEEPTPEPTEEPTPEPTEVPTPVPTEVPTEVPTPEPTEVPTPVPTEVPTPVPTEEPTPEPAEVPTPEQTEVPTPEPTEVPTPVPTATPAPTEVPAIEAAAALIPTAVQADVESEAFDDPFAQEEIADLPYGESLDDGEDAGNADRDDEDEGDETAEDELPEETQMPIETPIPVGEMINRYGVTNKPKVAIRSSMSQKKDNTNILERVPAGTYIYMLQERVNDNGENWVAIVYNGGVAYMMAQFLDPLTQAESNAYMADSGEIVAYMTAAELSEIENQMAQPEPAEELTQPEVAPAQEEESSDQDGADASAVELAATAETESAESLAALLNETFRTEAPEEETAAVAGTGNDGEAGAEQEPEPEPTVLETPIPAGAMINRYGTTNTKGVNVRTEPNEKAKKVVSNLKKGTKIYMVREEINEAGQSWTRVLVKGKTGFIKSEYLDVMTQADSDVYMATLKTPVPPVSAESLETSAPEATEEPTEEPESTAAPTATPALTEEPTETPAPTEEPTATPAPTEEPTATPAPTEEPTATPAPTEEPTATPAPTEEPTETPAPTEEPTETPAPTEEPTATPVPTEEPTATPVPTEEPTVTPVPTEEPTMTPEPSEVLEEPTPSPTAQITAEPPQITGYAITIGDGAYVRNWPSSNSVIMDELPANKVVFVNGQTYVDGVAWHQVSYSGQLGYVRADMLRMMGENEVIEYLDRLNATPEPTAAITVQPYNPSSLSSYGYTTTTVNFRESASTTSNRIRQLKKYAFCLVLGTTEVNGETWYRVTYDGKTGYIKGDYFKQLSLSELENFLGSQDYLEGIANNATSGSSSSSSSSSSGTSTAVVSAEDQKVSTWTNPDSGIVVSYEPFDPFATAAPLATEEPNEYLDSLVRDVQNGTATREQLENLLKSHYQGLSNQDTLVAEGLAYIEGVLAQSEAPTNTPEPSETPVTVEPEPIQEETQGSRAIGWILGAAAVLAAGGGGYAWYSAQQKKRKAAQAAAQKRAAAARKQQGTPSGARATGTAGTAAGTAAAAQSSQSGRTGTYTKQNGRPTAQPISTAAGQNQAAQQRKPYGNSVENPYARYTTRNAQEPEIRQAAYQPQNAAARTVDSDAPFRRPDLSGEQEEASFTASYRPENNEAPRTTSRRRTRSERYNQEDS